MRKNRTPQELERYNEYNFTEEEMIIVKIRRGDESAISDIKAKYGFIYRRIMMGILKDRQDVFECENDLLLSLWNKIRDAETYDLPRNLRGYIWKVARNKALDRLRFNSRRITTDPITEVVEKAHPHNVEDEIIARAMKQSIAAYVENELPYEEYELYIMKYFFCMDNEKISRYEGISKNAVASKLNRLRGKIRRHLTMEGFL